MKNARGKGNRITAANGIVRGTVPAISRIVDLSERRELAFRVFQVSRECCDRVDWAFVCSVWECWSFLW